MQYCQINWIYELEGWFVTTFTLFIYKTETMRLSLSFFWIYEKQCIRFKCFKYLEIVIDNIEANTIIKFSMIKFCDVEYNSNYGNIVCIILKFISKSMNGKNSKKKHFKLNKIVKMKKKIAFCWLCEFLISRTILTICFQLLLLFFFMYLVETLNRRQTELRVNAIIVHFHSESIRFDCLFAL